MAIEISEEKTILKIGTNTYTLENQLIRKAVEIRELVIVIFEYKTIPSAFCPNVIAIEKSPV
jgi:hypothetical protein